MNIEYKTISDNIGGSGPVYPWMLEDEAKDGWRVIDVSTGSNGDRSFLMERVAPGAVKYLAPPVSRALSRWSMAMYLLSLAVIILVIGYAACGAQ